MPNSAENNFEPSLSCTLGKEIFIWCTDLLSMYSRVLHIAILGAILFFFLSWTSFNLTAFVLMRKMLQKIQDVSAMVKDVWAMQWNAKTFYVWTAP